MMLRCKVFLILMLGTFAAHAQPGDTLGSLFYHEGMGLSYRSPTRSAISIQSTATIHGNSLTRNALTQALGGTISRIAVEDMIRVHKQPQTRWGMEHHSGLSFALPQKDEKNFRHHFVFGVHHLFELNASEDFVGAIFKGNAHLKGKEIYSNPLSWRFLSWKKLGWGVSTQKRSSKGLIRANVTTSLLHGGNAMRGSFSTVSLFTAADLSELRVSALGTAQEFPQASFGHGWGLAADAGILFQKETQLFEASITNLGLMHYGKQVVEYQWDTTLVFKGATWDRDRRAPVLPAWVSDSVVQNTALGSGPGPALVALPTDLLVRWTLNLNKVHELGIMARARLSDVYVPQITGIHKIRCFKKCLVAHELGYGGYRNFFWDAEVMLELANRLEFGARFFGLNTLISPQSRGGYGASARLVWVPGKSAKQ